MESGPLFISLQSPCPQPPLALQSPCPVFYEPQVPFPLAICSLPIRLCALWTLVSKPPLAFHLCPLALWSPVWVSWLHCPPVPSCPLDPMPFWFTGCLPAPSLPPQCPSDPLASISMPFCLSASLVLCLHVPLSTPKDFLRVPHLPLYSDREPERVCLNQLN